jgi:hypothetical protein
MKTLIEGYRNFPGEHCGSVSMRGLLHHYCGLALSEPAVFGLASGVACVYLEGDGLDPARMLFGRSLGLELDLADNLQIDYRERTEEDDDLAWQKVREEVLAGRPTMLSGDILYLDYREYKVHFPGHRFVLLGFDDETEKVWIADRLRVEPELCSFGALRRSRNPPEGLSTNNLWGRFHGTEVGRSLAEASRVAIDRCAKAMLSTSGSDGPGAGSMTTGIRAIRRFAEDLGEWPARADASWLASYNARCIEKFGNGGGNFRRLYAGFLEWVPTVDASLVPREAAARATAAADGWTALSSTLADLARDVGDAEGWKRARRQALQIADLEEALFSSLPGGTSGASF